MSDVPFPKPKRGRTLAFVLAGAALFIILAALLYSAAFGPVGSDTAKAQFLVTPGESVQTVASDLAKQGYIRGAWVFNVAYLRASDGKGIRPGGYELSTSMDAWSIASALVEAPYVAWVTIPVGMRKEQIGSLLAKTLGWTPAQLNEWNTVDTATAPNYIEGVYFPDTYLIPTDEPPAVIAERMRDHFKEQFAPYADQALKKNIPWPTVLTIASLIQREAGSAADMPIISGIIQKRLASGMPLAIDATLQYMRGSEATGWWAPPGSSNNYPDSPFNTYKRKGLPPHPIANPGLAAIAAALNPTPTDCVFYIHDTKGVMHCSPSYSGQLANIQKYLK
ncbi:MAG: hypothetical protein JWO84_134 [Parcubacteria group bacterium]|nr:hypothetical protein [Parcubacteria group bacterium]